MMTAHRAALAFWILGAAALAQEGTPPAAARTALETTAAKGDPKALAQALARRGGDWFDVILSVVADPMPPLDPTKAVIAALPDPEKKGVLDVLEPLAAAPAPTRQDFGAAAGALLGATRAFSDAKADSKTVVEAAAHAEGRLKAANHPWLNARGVAIRAMGAFDGGLATLGPDLAAAIEKLAALGDRFGASLLSAFHAKALADAGDLEKALAARERAYAGFKALGSLEKGGAQLRAVLGRIDLALAGPLFDEARDDAALDCCARARAIFKTADPMRDLEASAIEAAILIDRGNPAAAIEATKSHLNRVLQVKDKKLLTLFSTSYVTAMRVTGKALVGLEFLRKAIGRAKELGLSPNEESPLRAAMALTYVQSGQNEPAHAALEVAAKFADEPGLRPLARAALFNRAILLQLQSRPEEAAKLLERALATSLGGPILDRVASAGSYLTLAELLVDQGKPKDSLKYLREVASVAEDLGIRFEDVRLPTTGVTTGGGEPIQARMAAALGNYQTGPDWAGFEPVFLVTERRLQEVLARGAAEEKAPADMAERLAESDRLVLKLRRAASGTRPPIPEEEARRIVAFRKVMMDEAWSRAPTFALRQFPRGGSIKRARDHYCGVDGVIFGASATPQGAYVFAFSRDRFDFRAIQLITRITDSIASFAAVAKDPKATPSSWVAASTPVWEQLIAPMIPVFEEKKWIAVCPDPSTDGIPFEALVPGDAKSDNWRTLPYLMQRFAIGRLPTSSLAPEVRSRRNQQWVQGPFVAVVSAGQAVAGLPFAQAFDPTVSAEKPVGERAGVFKLGEASPGGAESAPERRPRFMIFGHGIGEAAVSWTPPTPTVVCVLDPVASKDGVPSSINRWMIRGVRGVIAPKGPIEKPVADALAIGVLKSFEQDGGNPIEALTMAKRALLTTTGKPLAPGLTDAHYHPVQWTQMQTWLVSP